MTRSAKSHEAVDTDTLHLIFYFLINAFKTLHMEKEGKIYIQKDEFTVGAITEIQEDMMMTLRTLDGASRKQRVDRGSYVVVIRPGHAPHQPEDWKARISARRAELEKEFDAQQELMKDQAKLAKKALRASTPKKGRG